MTGQTRYLLDSDVFITAKNTYYAFDICPGFWESLLYHHSSRMVFSIDRVRSELLSGSKTDDLVKWVTDKVPKSFFSSVEDSQVLAEYTQIMLWVQRHSRYFDAAKAKFATGADGWLVAYARVHGFTVVTNETSAPESRNAIKLPDVCAHFDVQYQNTFDLLRSLGVRFNFQVTTP